MVNCPLVPEIGPRCQLFHEAFGQRRCQMQRGAGSCLWSHAPPPPPGSVDTTKTRSDPQRVRMSSGEGPIGAAKGKQPNTEALCQPPPLPTHTHTHTHYTPARASTPGDGCQERHPAKPSNAHPRTACRCCLFFFLFRSDASWVQGNARGTPSQWSVHTGKEASRTVRVLFFFGWGGGFCTKVQTGLDGRAAQWVRPMPALDIAGIVQHLPGQRSNIGNSHAAARAQRARGVTPAACSW